MNSVTFIIVNRGGKEIERVVNNFKKTFKSYFDKIDFIVVEQRDNLPFKRGQLYNIGVKYCETEYIALIDNDVINLDSFNPIKKYEEFGKHPYVAFDEISQITYVSNEKYKITISEKRLSGFGAFDFMKKEDFIKYNGFSNLCIGWGAEDNILNEKIKFKRFVHKLGHITHPRRINNDIKLTESNRSIYTKYKKGEIKSEFDGYKQTTFRLIETKIKNDIKYLYVDNISVINDYKYQDLFKSIKNIESNEYKKNDGLSICITAYKAKQFIKETLDSIKNQTWFINNKNYEILIGIDGCIETLNYCIGIQKEYDEHFKFYMMDSNKGTYITSNTLMKIAQYNNLLRFDSDDIMPNNFIEKLLDSVKQNDYFQFKFINFGEQNYSGIANGAAFLTKNAFEKCGGYLPWICAADKEIMIRLKKLVRYNKSYSVYFNRRVHTGSLQYSIETDMKSKLRAKYHKYIDEQSEKKLITDCVTNSYKEIKKITLDTQEKPQKSQVVVNPTQIQIEQKSTNIVTSSPIIEKEKPIIIKNEETKVNLFGIDRVLSEINNTNNNQEEIPKILSSTNNRIIKIKKKPLNKQNRTFIQRTRW